MKLNKIFIYLSINMCCIFLLISQYLTFSKNGFIETYYSNICLNLFAGFFILLVTSIFNYMLERTYILEELTKKCLEFEKKFDNIGFFVESENISKEEYFKVFLESNDELEIIEEEKQNLYKKHINSNKDKENKDFNKIIKQYIDISNTKLSDLYDLNAQVDLLFDINNKKRDYIYYSFVEYISKIIDEIKNSSLHFKLYLESENGNYKANKIILIQLQSKININCIRNKPVQYLNKMYYILWELTYLKKYNYKEDIEN